MKNSLLFSLLLIVSFVKAQEYIPFPTENVIWSNATYENPTNIFLAANYYCANNEDTLIGEEVYTKLNLCAGEYKGAYRSSAGAVYYVPKTETAEYLLYDFTAEAGDTLFNVYATDGVFNYVVASVDSTLIGARYHKRVEIEGGVYWIEGIGSMQGILTTSMINISGFDLKLACMSAADMTYAFNGWDYFAEGSCSFNVGIDEPKKTTELKIYPNPCQHNVTIFNTFTSIDEVTVLDGLGRSVEMTLDGLTDRLVIDMEPLPNGIYYLLLRADGNLYQQKIVKD